jgi:hypothetical protein
MEPNAEDVRKITKALADLDVLFSLGESDGIKNWRINFAVENHAPILIQIGIQPPWVLIFHMEELPTLDAGEIRDLLRLNTSILVARIGLTDDDRVNVASQLAVGDLTAESLKTALHAVVAATVLVRNPDMRPKAGRA